MFWRNTTRRLTAIAVQLGHARNPKINTVAKSSYYRSATLLLHTIIEGAVYQLVKKHAAPSHNLEKIKEHKKLHEIDKSVFGTTEDVYICEKVVKDLHIDDNGVTFAKLNLYLKHKGIITSTQYRNLESIRKERNKLHLQGLTTSDTGYTKKKFSKATKTLDFLFKKI